MNRQVSHNGLNANHGSDDIATKILKLISFFVKRRTLSRLHKRTTEPVNVRCRGKQNKATTLLRISIALSELNFALLLYFTKALSPRIRNLKRMIATTQSILKTNFVLSDGAKRSTVTPSRDVQSKTKLDLLERNHR